MSRTLVPRIDRAADHLEPEGAVVRLGFLAVLAMAVVAGWKTA